MEYVKKLWKTLILVPDDKHSVFVFRLLELLTNLNKGSIDTTPSHLYTLLLDNEFTGFAEQ
jgi:hypothetical protein